MVQVGMMLYRAMNPSKIVSVILMAALCSVAASAYAQMATTPAKPADVEQVSKWLKANAIPLKSVAAGAGFADLQPLKKVLKDVKIVGLGESTHGTREFFQFKHRMLEFLVKEMGYTVFAIEASAPACLNINDYVVYGKGDKGKALASQGFWTWRTDEVLDLIDWMREYNKNLPEAKRIKFLGYDMQSYDDAYKRVYPYLQRVAPEYLEKKGPDFLPTRVNPQELEKKSDEEKTQFRAKISEVVPYIDANKERFSKASSPREYGEVLHCARVMEQFADTFALLSTDPQLREKQAKGGRDLYMAKNHEYIMKSEGPNTKIVSWAHNGHISLDGYGPYAWSMGRHLQQMYGKAYYALGFSFNQGGFQAINTDREDTENRGLVEFVLGPANEGTIDWYLAQPGIKNYVVDFRMAKTPPEVTRWLATGINMKVIGSIYNKKTPNIRAFVRPVVLKDQFDGMIFIDTTTRARPCSRDGRC